MNQRFNELNDQQTELAAILAAGVMRLHQRHCLRDHPASNLSDNPAATGLDECFDSRLTVVNRTERPEPGGDR